MQFANFRLRGMRKAALLLLALAFLGWFLHAQGEAVKGLFVYCCEGPGAPENPPGYGMGVAAIIGLSAVHAQKKGYTAPAVCNTDFEACAKELAWNKKIERACVNAVLFLKEATQKIKNEPSVVLGFNKVMAEWQALPVCSPFSSNLGGIGKSKWGCYVDNAQIEFYGLPAGMMALEGCMNEMAAAPYAPPAPTP